MTAQISLTSLPDPSARVTPIPLLSITHGLHRGVSLALENPVYTVGSAGDVDLLLSDPGIAARHLALRFAAGQVAVEALGGAVIVVARHGQEIRIPVGSGHRARLPLTVRVGAAVLTLSPPTAGARAAAPAAPISRNKAQWVIALVLMCLCVGAFAYRGQPQASQASQPSPGLSTPDGNRTVHAPNDDGSRASAAQAKVWLEQQLDTASLTRINVNETDGQLSVEGRYDPSEKSRWTSVQQAFDARFGQQVVLHSSVSPRTDIAKPRVRFQAVWLGEHPYVVSDSGKRLYPGAVLADDWTLERIENNQVILARGAERFAFTL
jgi:hypothetical protein